MKDMDRYKNTQKIFLLTLREAFNTEWNHDEDIKYIYDNKPYARKITSDIAK